MIRTIQRQLALIFIATTYGYYLAGGFFCPQVLSFEFVILAENQSDKGQGAPIFSEFIRTLKSYTSIEPGQKTKVVAASLRDLYDYPLLFARVDQVQSQDDPKILGHKIVKWLLAGGTLIMEGTASRRELDTLVDHSYFKSQKEKTWKVISPDHELTRSFFLLKNLPICPSHTWREYRSDGRMMILHTPTGFLHSASDEHRSAPVGCFANQANYQENLKRTLINLIMVILTTDYKKDQIHLPEILKRIR
ncbi:MAG: DUF4159 domain-containing protein [Proteobacteria bacterium]|nr:DUF4159 domain-containing protein [Pseudomonadota bacterium]